MEYRCAGPNCGVTKGNDGRGWLMWTSYGEWDVPVLHLSRWDEQTAEKEGGMYVCGEGCAQKLQSQFMGNLLKNAQRRA